MRTNPVTGWKSIFPVGGHVKHINGLTDEESTKLLQWFLDLVYRNHDLTVRLKWQNKNDIGKHTSSIQYNSTSPRSNILTSPLTTHLLAHSHLGQQIRLPLGDIRL